MFRQRPNILDWSLGGAFVLWSVRSVTAVVPPTPPHGRKLQIGEVSVRVPLDRPCENAGQQIPGRLLNG